MRDIRVGLNLALYRTFAVPRIAELLVHTGQIQENPHKRSIDTGLFMYELIEAGYDTDRGRHVVRALNTMHHRWPIAAQDYLYVLTTFIVVPTRWLEIYGPRALTFRELAATTAFYCELGRRMNIRDLPATYTQAEQIFDDYERDHIACSDAGKALMHATKHVMREQLPRPLKPAATMLTRLILDDHVAQAVGLKPAPRTGKALMRLIGTIRRRIGHRRAIRSESWFKPGRAVDRVYPHGYQLGDLGPNRPTDPSTGETSSDAQ